MPALWNALIDFDGDQRGRQAGRDRERERGRKKKEINVNLRGPASEMVPRFDLIQNK